MGALGDSFDPLGEHLQDPYPFYARARAEEPVFWSPRMNAWVVTRYRDVSTVLRDNATFSNANAIRTIDDPPAEVIQEFLKLGYPQALPVIGADGEVHRRMRAPFARNFAADRATAAEHVMRGRVSQAIDAFGDRGRAELMDELIRPVPIAVVTHMYGVEEVDEAMVKAGTRGFLMMQGNLARMGLPLEEQVKAAKAAVELCHVMRDVVSQRRAAPRENDLVTAFAAAVAPLGGPMTVEQEARIVLNLATIFVPGHETTSPQFGNGLRHLLSHRDQWELLCERPELIGQAVEEFCRYDTSVPGMFRLVKNATTIAGQELQPGDEVFLALLSANRDEALCDRPDDFDVIRKPTRHLTFGFGAHYCLGAETGRREMRIALEILTRRLPGLRLADRPVEIEPVFVTRGPLELHVEW